MINRPNEGWAGTTIEGVGAWAERFNLCAGLFAGTITKRGSPKETCYLRGAVAGIVIKLV